MGKCDWILWLGFEWRVIVVFIVVNCFKREVYRVFEGGCGFCYRGDCRRVVDIMMFMAAVVGIREFVFVASGFEGRCGVLVEEVGGCGLAVRVVGVLREGGI